MAAGLLMAVGLAGGLPAAAQGPAVTLAQVRALPPLPAEYSNEDVQAKRLAWLQQRLADTLNPVERYRLQRHWFNELYVVRQLAEAAPLCTRNPPLREDVLYRANCVVATSGEGQDPVPALLALANEARETGNPTGAAQVLANVAWRQSQAGDVAGAFEHYELALSLVPPERVELLTDLMMDTAASYIVNGDPHYIRKGIDLLADARAQLERALADPAFPGDKGALKSGIALSEFNRGIAYVLHLHEHAKALQHFDRVTAEPNPYLEDALVFAAVAAVELGQVNRAQAYLARAAQQVTETMDPTVRQYLTCYRQLVLRRISAAQPVTACLALKPDTTTEVKMDVYKRLAAMDDPSVALAGLQGLKTLLLETVEPQLRRRGSNAASKAELQRLQRESELKSQVLDQQTQLQKERDASATQRQRLFMALTLVLVLVVALVSLLWRSKKKLADQYERLSLVDTLTQLGNRRFLEQSIERELAHLQRSRRDKPQAALGVFLFDVDHFKAINDRHGHAAGDAVLVTLGQRLRAVTRDTDLLVRWGGEEFLLVARLEAPEHGAELAERLMDAIRTTPFALPSSEPLPVTCTLGAVVMPFLPGPAPDPWTALVGLADLALYEGKARGRNRWVQVHNTGLATAAELTEALQGSLQQAVDRGWVRVSSSG